MRRIIFTCLALALVAAAAPKTAKPRAAKLPAGPGQTLVQSKCSSCHVLTVVTSKRQDADHWAATVDQMISRGAEVSDADYDRIVDYLAKNFGARK